MSSFLLFSAGCKLKQKVHQLMLVQRTSADTEFPPKQNQLRGTDSYARSMTCSHFR